MTGAAEVVLGAYVLANILEPAEELDVQDSPTDTPSKARWHLVPDLRAQYELQSGGTVTLGIYAERIDGSDTGRYCVKAWGPWTGPSRYPDFDHPPTLMQTDAQKAIFGSVDDAYAAAVNFAQIATEEAAPTPSEPLPPAPIPPGPSTPGGSGMRPVEVQEVGTADFVQSGDLSEVTRDLRLAGRGGDTDVVHVNEQEKIMLKESGGAGTVNPRTGLLEYNTEWVYEEQNYYNTDLLAYRIISTPTLPREFWTLEVYSRNGTQAWSRNYPVVGDMLDAPAGLRADQSAWFEADALAQQAIINLQRQLWTEIDYEGDTALEEDPQGQWWEGSLVDDASHVFGDTPDQREGTGYVAYTTDLTAILSEEQDSPFSLIEMGGITVDGGEGTPNRGNGFAIQGNEITLTASNRAGTDEEGWFRCIVKPGYRVIWDVDYDYQNRRPDSLTDESEMDIDENFTVYMESGDTMEFNYRTSEYGNWGERTNAGKTSLVLDGNEMFTGTPSIGVMLPIIEIKLTFVSGQILVDPELPPPIIEPDPDPEPDDPPELSCPDGFVWDAVAQACVPDGSGNGNGEEEETDWNFLGIAAIGAVLLIGAFFLFGRGLAGRE